MNCTEPLFRILLLSGAQAVGKSTVASALRDTYGFSPISSSGYLRQISDEKRVDANRLNLQEIGDALDEETDFEWIVAGVAGPLVMAHPHVHYWLVDSVRKHRQVHHFRAKFGEAVRHVHLRAPEDVLRSRYQLRAESYDTPYEARVLHPNEVSARSLYATADASFDTTVSPAPQIAESIFNLWKCGYV